MKASFITAAIGLAAVAIWWGGAHRSTALDQAAALNQAAPALQSDDGIEVLTRGPVHEAFAEPVMLDQRELMVVERAPPEPIDELPPELRPEGENVVWVHGYWAWDEELRNFLWVSGIWRDEPPGREWVTGYWSEGEGGYYWTPGFWISTQVEEIAYLPPPPESLEVGPQIEAPSEDHIWAPGGWRWYEGRYLWQPGQWIVARPGWVWVPARYVWCPGGYVYVDGYWDYALASRGVLFAPVYYHRPVYQLVDYYYTPTVVINPHILTVHLFAHPRYNHYYFGDYYGPRYVEIGIVPWFSFHTRRIGYDPLFTYYSWYYGRREPNWFVHVQRRHRFFAANEAFRPARSYSELRRQRVPQVRTGDVQIQNVVAQQTNLAVTLNQYVENVQQEAARPGRREERRFTRVGDRERRAFQERARELRGIADRRLEVETAPSGEATVGRRERGERRTLRLDDPAVRRGPGMSPERAVTGAPTPAEDAARDETARQDGLRFRRGRVPGEAGVVTDPAPAQDVPSREDVARPGMRQPTDEAAAAGEAGRRIGAVRRAQEEQERAPGTRPDPRSRWIGPQPGLPGEPGPQLGPDRAITQPGQALDRADRAVRPGMPLDYQPRRGQRQLPIYATPDGQPPSAIPDAAPAPTRGRVDPRRPIDRMPSDPVGGADLRPGWGGGAAPGVQPDRFRRAVPGERERSAPSRVRAFLPPQADVPAEPMPSQGGGALGAGAGAMRPSDLPGRSAPGVRPGFERIQPELPSALPPLPGERAAGGRLGGAAAGRDAERPSPRAPWRPENARAGALRQGAAEEGIPNALGGTGQRGARWPAGAEPRSMEPTALPRRLGRDLGDRALVPERAATPRVAPRQVDPEDARRRREGRRGR